MRKLAKRLEWDDFTPRETEVFEHIVRGRSNKLIAELLGVSEASVKSHINKMLGKLGVSDRTQAVTTAIQRGLVTLGEDTVRARRRPCESGR